MNVFTEQDVTELIGEDMTLSKSISELLNEGDFLGIGQLICDKILAREEELAMVGLSQHDPDICSACNGSGEGMFDGSICSICKGSGTERDNSFAADEFHETDAPEYPENYQGDF